MKLADPVPEMPPIDLLLRVGEREIVVSKIGPDLGTSRMKAAWRATQGARVVEIEGERG